MIFYIFISIRHHIFNTWHNFYYCKPAAGSQLSLLPYNILGIKNHESIKTIETEREQDRNNLCL